MLDFGDGKWYRFDDENVMETEPSFATKSAYLLFYCRTDIFPS